MKKNTNMNTTPRKVIYFDLDGTVYPLYEQPDWLARLRASDPTTYAVEAAMVDMVALHDHLFDLMDKGFEVGVISWLSMGGSEEYAREVRRVKREWVKKFLPMATEIHIVKYGTPKHSVATADFGIIVDDDAKVRATWTKGLALDPAEVIH